MDSNNSDLNLLSDSVSRFLLRDFSGNIYNFIGERISELTQCSLVFVSEYDPSRNSTIVRAISGPSEWREEIIRLIVRDPLDLELDFLESARSQMILGKLVRIPGGLFELTFGRFPEELCHEIERKLGISAIFAMPFSSGKDFLGTVAILAQDPGEIPRANLIELIVSLGGMTLQQIQIEQERAKLLKQLNTERNLWKTTVESMPDPVTVCDSRGIATYMNPIYSRLVNLTIDPSLDLEQHPEYYKITHLDGTPFEVEDLPLQKAALNDENVPEIELVQRISAEEKRHLVFSAAPLHDADGHLLGAVAVGRDITSQRQAEAERQELFRQLESEKALLKTIIDNAPEGIVLTDAEGSLILTNPAARDLFMRAGFLMPVSLEHTGFETLDANLIPIDHRHIPLVESALDGIIHRNREIVIRWPDGYLRYMLVNTAPIRDADGRLTGAIGVSQDISSLKEAEEALQHAKDELELRVQERTQDLLVANRELSQEIINRKQAESQIRLQATALESAADGIVITDRNARIVWCNPAFSRITSFSREEIYGQNPRIFRSGHHDRAYYKNLWDTILSGKVWYGETINRHKDGSLYTVEGSITPVLDENGQISHFISIKQDITERKHQQELIHQHAARAETLVRVAENLSTSLELNAVLDLICKETARAIDVEVVTLSLFDPNRDGFFVAAGVGAPAETFKQMPLLPRAEHDAVIDCKGLVYVIPDIRDDPSAFYYKTYRELDLRTEVDIHMRRKDQPVGCL